MHPDAPTPAFSPEASAASDIIVGIDLGTTNSLVAICDASGARVLSTPDQGPLVPSVVRLEADRVVVGRDAKARASDFPATTIASVKRLIGRSFADGAMDSAYVPYETTPGPNNTVRIRVPTPHGERLVAPEEVSAHVLREVALIARAALGAPVRRAVITVPAYFDDAQRQATKAAGALAGLEVVRIVPEPTAAALAYGFGLSRDAARNAGERNVCVYDLGGGTFDVSVLRITPATEGEAESQPEVSPSFYQVLATAGDTRLGGDDFDHALVSLVHRDLHKRFGIEPEQLPPSARSGLLTLCENVKVRLSQDERASIVIDLGEGRSYDRIVTRAEFESLIEHTVERTIVLCERALRDARRKGMGQEAIASVILVGGSSRIPLVRRRVRECFGIEPYTAIDPDQAVALGAAVQGAILSGALKGALLLDVIPLSLGIETAGGAFAKLIPRNSAVPAVATEMFSTGVDNQTGIVLTVLQGEREMAADCRVIAQLHIRGLPPMPAGLPQLEVTFAVDANGVLNVSAVERRSGKRTSLQVVPNHGLTKEEADRLEHEAIANVREDMARHRVADLVASARLDVLAIEKTFARAGNQLPEADARHLLEAVAGVKTLIESARHDWRSVDAQEFARAKQAMDEKSVRLHELAIAQSLRSE